LPLLEQDFYYAYGDKVEIVTICLEDNEERIISAILPFSLSYRVLIDKGRTAAKSYKVRGIPLNLVIDKEGIIRYRQLGYNPSAMREVVEQFL
jgi:peroxiredoxin